jgi:hypothetical protein
MVATRAACLNRVQGSPHRNCWAHFDNREGQAGMDLCIYCDVGFGFRSSPPIWGVVDPRGGVAKWLAAKVFPQHSNLLREIQNPERNASARTPKRFSWPRCASTVQIVRRSESTAETPVRAPTGFLEITGDYFPVFHWSELSTILPASGVMRCLKEREPIMNA